MPHIPESMIPYFLFPSGMMHNPIRCLGCGETFVLGNGIVYKSYFTHNGEVHYGHLMFCTISCLMHWLPLNECSNA